MTDLTQNSRSQLEKILDYFGGLSLWMILPAWTGCVGLDILARTLRYALIPIDKPLTDFLWTGAVQVGGVMFFVFCVSALYRNR